MLPYPRRLARRPLLRPLLLSALSIILPSIYLTAEAGKLRGELGFEATYFSDSKTNLAGEDLEQFNGSVHFMPEFFHEFKNPRAIFSMQPFFRLDQNDSERSHADIRELSWQQIGRDWELRLGLRKVFWGVTEFQHLVDIINQTDGVESVDGEEKLGQPMINFSLAKDWGILDLFILPGFRERTFRGSEGRPNAVLIVDTDNPSYEADAEEQHIDWAIRWQHYIGDWEFGLSHFYGTSREPRLLFNNNPLDPALIPRYDLINQSGLDLQYIYEDWLLKLETILRSGQGKTFTAIATGFEYTQIGILDSDADLGWVLEYMYDSREDAAPNFIEHDLFLGSRFTLNDEQSSEALFGLVYDPQNQQKLISLEANRRIGQNYRLDIEMRLFVAGREPPSLADLDDFNSPEAKLGQFADEDFIRLNLTRYF